MPPNESLPDPLHRQWDALRPDALRVPGSWKWGTVAPDVLPLWLADMDFPVAAPIRAALRDAADGWLGYELLLGDDELLQLVRAALVARGHPGVGERLDAVMAPGLLPLLYAAVRSFVPPGDDVLVMTPAYPPFLLAPRDQGRTATEVPLAQTADGWRLDLDALERAVGPRTRAIIACVPHNPVGRVWTRDEMAALAEFAERHDLLVISDEIWADLAYEMPQRPFAAASDAAARRTLTLVAPMKSYNTAGTPIAAAVSANPALVAAMREGTHFGLGHAGVMGVAMWKAALREGAPWLAVVRDYLRANRDHAVARLRDALPELAVAAPEATYLLWLDARRHRLGARVHAHLLAEGKVLLNDGAMFGAGWAGCVRLNFATGRTILDDALDRIIRALRG